MNPRQQFALENPLASAAGDGTQLLPYRLQRPHRTGVTLQSILAVDR